MSLPVEEVDNSGRAIFFRCPADISKATAYENHDVCSQERVYSLYEQRRLPTPKFRGFIYNYSQFLTLCSRCQNGLNKIKQKIDYKNIRAAYPCEADPSVVIMVMESSRSRSQVRLFRFPTAIMGTKFRYVIDQLQLAPVYESTVMMRGARHLNSRSSFSMPRTDDSESVTSAAHYFQRSAAFGPALRAFGEYEEEPKLPRVQPFAFSATQRSPLYQSNRTLVRHNNDAFKNFDSRDFEVHRPSRAGSRIARIDAGGSRSVYGQEWGRSQTQIRKQHSRQVMQVPSRNFNSRSIVQSTTRQSYLGYIEPEYSAYGSHHYGYDSTARRSTLGCGSRSGSVPRQYEVY